MLAGIAMGIQQNFTLAPAHAHLNLIGGVLLFVFGLYYRLIPAAGTTTLARIQGWLPILGGSCSPLASQLCSSRGRRSRSHRWWAHFWWLPPWPYSL
jgi:uncharacterized membrane protein HdeD (DUF308 family)